MAILSEISTRVVIWCGKSVYVEVGPRRDRSRQIRDSIFVVHLAPLVHEISFMSMLGSASVNPCRTGLSLAHLIRACHVPASARSVRCIRWCGHGHDSLMGRQYLYRHAGPRQSSLHGDGVISSQSSFGEEEEGETDNDEAVDEEGEDCEEVSDETMACVKATDLDPSAPLPSQDFTRSVVQVLTVHCVPNLMRPWEAGHDTESSSSAFVVDCGRRLLMTTAGAVS